jgi:hypothetical protein
MSLVSLEEGIEYQKQFKRRMSGYHKSGEQREMRENERE